jgi:hypothetical protein
VTPATDPILPAGAPIEDGSDPTPLFTATEYVAVGDSPLYQFVAEYIAEGDLPAAQGDLLGVEGDLLAGESSESLALEDVASSEATTAEYALPEYEVPEYEGTEYPVSQYSVPQFAVPDWAVPDWAVPGLAVAEASIPAVPETEMTTDSVAVPGVDELLDPLEWAAPDVEVDAYETAAYEADAYDVAAYDAPTVEMGLESFVEVPEASEENLESGKHCDGWRVAGHRPSVDAGRRSAERSPRHRAA